MKCRSTRPAAQNLLLIIRGTGFADIGWGIVAAIIMARAGSCTAAAPDSEPRSPAGAAGNWANSYL